MRVTPLALLRLVAGYEWRLAGGLLPLAATISRRSIRAIFGHKICLFQSFTSLSIFLLVALYYFARVNWTSVRNRTSEILGRAESGWTSRSKRVRSGPHVAYFGFNACGRRAIACLLAQLGLVNLVQFDEVGIVLHLLCNKMPPSV